MSLVQAFQVYKSCASSFAARSAVRSSVPFASRRLGAVRHYSEAKEKESEAADAKPQNDAADKLKKKEEEVSDLTGRLRYLQADFLNLQRNAAREKEQTKDFAITKFASDLLETVDVLAIALKSIPDHALAQPSTDVVESSSSAATTSADLPSPPPLQKSHQEYLNDLYTGVEMTHRLLLQTLFKYHVKPFEPLGDKFDPNRHEALYQAPIPGKEPGTVHDVQKTGYTIKDRVLRAAQVGVVQDTSS
ncbi:GrpE protein [Abortiporus biennis]